MKEIERKLNVLWAEFQEQADKFDKIADSTATDIARQYYRGQALSYRLAANEVRRVIQSIPK